MPLRRSRIVTNIDDQRVQAPWSATRSLQRRVKAVAESKGLATSTYVQNVLQAIVEREEASIAEQTE